MSYESTILARSPVFYLPLTETTGTTFADLTGNGHTGTMPSGGVTVAGADGPLTGDKAASFGDSGKIELAVGSGFPDFTAFSNEAWLQWNDTSLDQDFSFGFYSDGSRWGFDFYQYPSNRLQLFMGFFPGGPTGVHTAEFPLDHGACWHHYVWTYDGTAIKVYRDGALVATIADDTLAGRTASPSQPCAFYNFGESGAAFNLNHVAVYATALSVDEVAGNYAAMTPRQDAECFLDWVRLSHVSGQGYWQSRGDVTEEWAGGTPRLRLPLATLDSTPDTLVGQDPDTNLPAYCPAPVPSTSTTILVGGGSQPAPPTTCVQMRCGVSAACTAHLYSLYQNWARLLDPLVTLIVALGIAAFASNPLDDIIAGMAGAEAAEAGALETLLKDSVTIVTDSAFPTLTSDMLADIQKALFDQLTCTGDVVQITPSQITAWQTACNALTTWPIASFSEQLVSILLQFTPLADWQAAASTAGTSSACDAWS